METSSVVNRAYGMTAPPPRHQPRYPIVRAFPVETLAPYVGLSANALAWCADNWITTVADALRAMRPQGRSKVIKCPPHLQLELLRLIDPPGIPADWPLHPDAVRRIDQQFAHAPGVWGLIRRLIFDVKDRWSALLYLVHVEEDFLQYKGIGPTKLPAVLVWRDEMRKRHARPTEELKQDVLKGRDWNLRTPLGPDLRDPYTPLWTSAAEHGAQGYIGSVRYAGCSLDGTNRVCFVTQQTTYTLRWPDWAFNLAKDALLSGRKLFVMARGVPYGPNILEVHLLAE